MSVETQERLLKIHATGLYASLDPADALKVYNDCKVYLNVASQSSLIIMNKKDYFDLSELQFYLALITNHDVDAKLMLDRMSDQFGNELQSQRLAKLKAIYLEATSGVKESETYLNKIPKLDFKLDLIRHKTFLSKSTQSGLDYVQNLNKYLECKPSDVQAWFELSEVYLEFGNYLKSIFCLQQILLYVPFAYNIYFYLGKRYQAFAYKCLYDYSKKDGFNYNAATIDKFYNYHGLALKNYLKSVELCETYYKGWTGVYYLTKPLEFKSANLLKKFEQDAKRNADLHKVAQKMLQQCVSKEEYDKIVQ